MPLLLTGFAAEGTLTTEYFKTVNITNIPDDLTAFEFASADVDVEFDNPDEDHKVGLQTLVCAGRLL
jgi:hypothetical protein